MGEKLAVVTGASAGIGREMARQLAMRDYELMLVARREEKLKALAEDITGNIGKKAAVLKLDLTLAADRRRLVAEMEENRAKLSLLVNNAGFGALGPTLDTPVRRTLQMVELNVAALTELSWEAARLLTPKGTGGIINVASTAAFQAIPYMSVYAATKAFVLNFTEALAEENEGRGLRVMALCPGVTKSEFQQVAGIPEDDVALRRAMSVEECVQLGLEDFSAGKRISITGSANKLQVFTSWLLPRSWVTSIIGRTLSRSRRPSD
jgi:short-subunit dehydrogenase